MLDTFQPRCPTVVSSDLAQIRDHRNQCIPPFCAHACIHPALTPPRETRVRSLSRSPPTQQLIDRILRTVSETATAGRTLAQREENRIYCWYEGWLPDEDDRPTTQWEHAWIDSDLLRDTYPAATVATQPPLATGLIPHFDPNHQDVTNRIRQTRPSYQPPDSY